jgi:hypothetical protein
MAEEKVAHGGPDIRRYKIVAERETQLTMGRQRSTKMAKHVERGGTSR